MSDSGSSPEGRPLTPAQARNRRLAENRIRTKEFISANDIKDGDELELFYFVHGKRGKNFLTSVTGPCLLSFNLYKRAGHKQVVGITIPTFVGSLTLPIRNIVDIVLIKRKGE